MSPKQTRQRGLIYLASQSPRRRELLAGLGLEVRILNADIDEQHTAGELPDAYAQRLALAKARAGDTLRSGPITPVLGADTVVVAGDRVMGKPAGRDDAVDMLGALSGRSHWVHTGVAVVSAAREAVTISSTEVWFREITLAERREYWATGEPADKAGGYAIQGFGALFVTEIRGSYTGVMGLPLFETARLLQEFGYKFPGI
jgi:septum formation protein